MPTSYPDPNSRSARLFERATKVMPGGNTRLAVYQAPYPIYIKSAQGCEVTDVDGVTRIDLINNQSALVHGHAFAPAVTAAQQQVALGASFSGPTEHEVALAEHLHGRSPNFERVRFTNSGSEAVILAVKAARAFTGRTAIAKCEGAYHGSYDFVEASRGSSPANWGPADRPTPVAYTKGTPREVLDVSVVLPYNDIENSRAILDEAKHRLAAVIIEPVTNRPGMIPADRGYLEFLRQFTEKNGILLIFDEIITFRLAVGGAQEHYGVAPDMTTLGKAIGGGFPVGALAGRAEPMSVFDQRNGSPAVPHTGTFNGNPVTMVAGLATLLHYDAAAIKRVNRRGDELRAAITHILQKAGVEGQVTGLGSLFRLHFVCGQIRDYRTGYPSVAANKRLAAVHRAMQDSGFLLSVNCSGNISTVLGDAHIEAFLAALGSTIEATATS